MNGRPAYHWATNGNLFPKTPMYMVSRGDLVKFKIVNDTSSVHPMHLHGHHVLVLSRDGKPTTGAPGGSTPSTSRATRSTRSHSAPTTRASGWTTATTFRMRGTV
jgi:FtsP/CotA-like multicopper oxidase with cupredoxin domain